MFDNLNVRNKFLAVAAVPTVILLLTAVAAIAIADAPALMGIALAGVLLTVAAAVMVARGVTQRLDSVVTSVETLTKIRLAALAKRAVGDNASSAQLAAPSGKPVIEGHDEIGRLARSLAGIEPKALELINSGRETTSQNFGTVINRLASRTQVLLDEQIGFIDWLEATEEDADRLEQLFQLDHLATRMRRICESIIVLAGAGDTPGRDQPAALLDVLRVAMAENPRYLDISIRSGDDVDIVGPVACDLAHLVSELLSNATAFSPDDQTVELHATALPDGIYGISVIDHGIGMDEQRLASANRVIAAPPDIDLSLNDSFGLIVVGRLARRIGATVELSATPGAGVTVDVLLPASAIVSADQPAADSVADVENVADIDQTGPDQSEPAPAVAAAPSADAPAEQAAVEPELTDAPVEPPVEPAVAEPAVAEQPTVAQSTAEAFFQQPLAALPTEPALIDPAPSEPALAEPTPAEPTPARLSAVWDSPTAEPHQPAADSSLDAATADPAPAEVAPVVPTHERTDVWLSPSATQSNTLAEALPAIANFDAGVDGLLADAAGADAFTIAPGDEDVWKPPAVPDRAANPPAVPAGPADPSEEATAGSEPHADAVSAPDPQGTEPILDPVDPELAVQASATSVGLTRRRRTTGPEGRTVAPPNPLARASSRKPEELRSMITRYRDGLKKTEEPSDG